MNEPLVVRFKSRRPADELIVALMTHARNVWPSPNDPILLKNYTDEEIRAQNSAREQEKP